MPGLVGERRHQAALADGADPLLGQSRPTPGAGAVNRAAFPVFRSAHEKSAWIRAFLEALASEALNDHQLLMDLERGWVAARSGVGDRRRNSRAALAIDAPAAAPLLSATTLAGAIGMSIRRAIDLLDGFVRDELVVEVTHRAKRRLFALRGLTPLRDKTAPPRRPQPGRPSNEGAEAEIPKQTSSPAPLSPMARGVFDYSILEESIAHL